MKKYFLEPISGNLIIVDSNNGNTTICPELKNVRVFNAGGAAYMTRGLEDNEMQSDAGPKAERKASAKKSTQLRICGKCGGSGHNARTCPAAGKADDEASDPA